MAIPTRLRRLCVHENDPAVLAHYRIHAARLNHLVFVLDDDDHAMGVIGIKDVEAAQFSGVDIEKASAGDICNRNFTSILDTDDRYTVGRGCFADKPLNDLPILSVDGTPVDIWPRFLAFFRDAVRDRTLPYPHYAACIVDAAQLAVDKGYSAISVIEFGVAGGLGLRLAELYAEEAGRLAGIDIEVYGFDSGQGLFAPVDYRDLPNQWSEGDFTMDVDALRETLDSATLVLGDVAETVPSFFAEHAPAPIGAIFIDVDQYTPTTHILSMLHGSDDYFLPIVLLYFDDLSPYDFFQGETLALREFNQSTERMKISPETYSLASAGASDDWAPKVRRLHRFEHPAFARSSRVAQQLPLTL